MARTRWPPIRDPGLWHRPGSSGRSTGGCPAGTGRRAGLKTIQTASGRIASEPDVTRLVEDTAAARGCLDYLFNNAGFAIGGDTRDLTLDDWQRVLNVDLYGVLYGMRAAYPIMARQGSGHIVNTSSAAAFFAVPGNAPYCTAKHALVGLSLSLRLEGVDLGVKVSCVCPGFVRTSVYQNAEVAGMTLPADLTREQAAGAPAKMMAPSRAAQLILDGVARNKALIVFPASIRWARRASYYFPGLGDRILLRQMRQWRTYRTAASAAMNLASPRSDRPGTGTADGGSYHALISRSGWPGIVRALGRAGITKLHRRHPQPTTRQQRCVTPPEALNSSACVKPIAEGPQAKRRRSHQKQNPARRRARPAKMASSYHCNGQYRLVGW